MIYTDSDYFIQIYVGWGCQIKIDARNNFDVLSNGSPAEPSPPTALSASVCFLSGLGLKAVRGHIQMWEHQGLLLQWPSHCKIIINRGNTIVIFKMWGERGRRVWVNGFVAGEMHDKWKNQTKKKKQNKKLSIFSFFVFFPQMNRVQHWNRHGRRDVKKQRKDGRDEARERMRDRI